MQNDPWPALPLEEWSDTYATLHMWTQIVGKIKLGQTPLLNHWWNVTLRLSARGLTTSAMPDGDRTFEMEFDFIDHQLHVRTEDGANRSVPLAPRSVADFYHEVLGTLHDLGITVKIWPMPVEVEDPIRFDEDQLHASYDPQYAARFWHILERSATVLEAFRGSYIGKCSPVHFYWGSFDLAVTRFSGRRAPEREGADATTREAYSHEVISHGFWPGQRAAGPVERARSDGLVHAPAFYSYTAPEPPGLREAPIGPEQAFYCPGMKEFILLYEDVRNAATPNQLLMDFLQSTYTAGADLARWDRAALERSAA